MMRRNVPIIETGAIDYQELIQQAAFHEAGHAAGIHFYLKENCLPSVLFQIKLTKSDFSPDSSAEYGWPNSSALIAEIEGGRLVPELPVGLLESANYYLMEESDAYRSAFEADMINFLIGALAEAKHVSLRDHHHFDPCSMNLSSLCRYGGLSDLEEVNEFLAKTIASKSKCEETLFRVFRKALHFIACPDHWRAIEQLARYILAHKAAVICCDQAIAVMEHAIAQNSPVFQSVRESAEFSLQHQKKSAIECSP